LSHAAQTENSAKGQFLNLMFKRQVTIRYRDTDKRNSGITVVLFALLYLLKAVSTCCTEALSLCTILFSFIAFLSSGDLFFFGGQTTIGAGAQFWMLLLCRFGLLFLLLRTRQSL
jgi:hypothetical protein